MATVPRSVYDELVSRRDGAANQATQAQTSANEQSRIRDGYNLVLAETTPEPDPGVTP